MARRDSDVGMLCCAVSVREQLVIDEMKGKIGIATDADLVRLALYQYARHLDQRLDTDLFHLRGGRCNRVRKRREPRPKALRLSA